MSDKCCVPGCTSAKPNVHLHAFPRSEKRIQLWLRAVNNPDLLTLTKSTIVLRKRVCRKHFEVRYFRSRPTQGSRFFLTPDAYPTLFTEQEIKSGVQTSEISGFHGGDNICVTDWLRDHNYCLDARLSVATQEDAHITQLSESSAECQEYSTSADVCDDVVNTSYSEQHNPCSPEQSDLKAVTEPGDQIIHQIILLNVTQGVQHRDVSCDSCKEKVYGFRYKCVECADCDLCSACEARGEHPHHYVLRIPQPLQFRKAQALVDRIRNSLAEEGLFQNHAPKPFNIQEIDSEDGDNLDPIKEELPEFELNEMENPHIDEQVNETTALKTDLFEATDVQFSYREDEHIASTPRAEEDRSKVKRLNSDSFTNVSSIEDDNIYFKKARTKDFIDPLDISLRNSHILQKQCHKSRRDLKTLSSGHNRKGS